MDLLRGRGATFEGDEPAPRPAAAPPRFEVPELVERGEVTPVRMPPPTFAAPFPMLGTPLGTTDSSEDLTQMGAPLPPPRPRPVLPRVESAVVPPAPLRSPPTVPPRLSQARPAVPPKPNRPPKRFRWLRVLGTLVILAVGVVVGGYFGAQAYYGAELPSVEVLGAYRPPTVSVVYDEKGELMGEIYEKRRYVVDLAAMPPHLTQAFISAEDASYYEHGGIDYMGIVRAVGRNALAGKRAQGASTITQQVARNFLLTNEKTFARKIKEALLAWRIEETFDKEHILYLYLNQIYLGSGAYGVEAASRVYFDKHVGELTLAQASMLAGLPQRPSDYSPHRHPEKAKARQSYVLGQMVDNGYITQSEADAAYAAEVNIVERTNEFLVKAPWFTEHIRRYLVETYGQDRVYNEGLVVTSTCDLALQQEAQRAVTGGVADAEERLGGWRGPHAHLEGTAREEKLAELTRGLGPVVEGQWYPGMVTALEKRHAIVNLGGVNSIIPLAWTTWAWPVVEGQSARGTRIDDMNKALKVGDLITVEVESFDFRKAEPLVKYKDAGEGPFVAASLFQEPDIQGALWSYRLNDGAVVAMVGGVNFHDTQFNRATQAQRQVGSTFKPIVYAAAIASRKFTTGTIVQDAPLVFNSLKNTLWKPANYGEDYLGDITLRKALALSRNVVTVRVLDSVGLDPVVALARQLGIEGHMDVDLSMGLGSASLTIPEVARSYSAFATQGRKVNPHYVQKVVDRDGMILEEFKPVEFEQVLDPAVATIMNWMLVEVATNGTAGRSQKLGLHIAGKTGTTNDNRDAWFVGYTPSVLTAVWVGYDQPKSLGGQATGGHTALPIWMQYMEKAAPKALDRPFASGGGVIFATIDEATGRPSATGRSMPFLPGTVPGGMAVEAGQKTSEDLLTTEW